MFTGLFAPAAESAQPVVNRESIQGMVLYADGGCDQKRSIGGWGIHGYLYSKEPPTKGIGCGQVIATDEGYCNKTHLSERRSKEDAEMLNELYKNPDIFKTAQAVTVLKYYDYFAGITDATNNIAELKAAINALTMITETHSVDGTLCEATLYSDSQYVIHGITKWITGWLKNNWINGEGEPVKNKELWVELDAAANVLVSLGINLRWAWIRGHSGEQGNTQADINATAGKVLEHKQVKDVQRREFEPQGYWNETADYDRMFSQPNWYFNTKVPTNVLPDGRSVYCLGNHGDSDEYVGRKSSEASYTLLYSAQPFKEIEIVKEYQDSVTPNVVPSFIIGKLAKLRISRNLLEIQQHGTLLLSRARGRDVNLIMPNDDLITREMNPPRMAYTLVDTFSQLATLLQDFTKASETVVVTEITDILYELDSSKKKPVIKFNKDLTASVPCVKVNVGYRTKAHSGASQITLVFGKDLYLRNDLSALADRAPKVYVITWEESAVVFRYATIIVVDDAVSITAGVYSNLKLLTDSSNSALKDFKPAVSLRTKSRGKVSRHFKVSDK